MGSRDGWKPTNEDDEEDYADDGEFDEFGRSTNRPGDAGGSADQQVAKDQSNGILGTSASSSIGSSSGKKRPRVWDRNRSAEDYMDDRDYEDWGGPTGVSAEYSDPSASKAIAANVDDGSQQQEEGLGLLVPTELLQSMAGPTDAIGRLLLRKLGWREGSSTDDKSSAYVPTHDDNGGDENANDKACSHEALLSKKRLKKIQLSERGHSLPPAKIDTYGLGFDPFRNAPEFAAHREQRRKRAEERARAAGGGGGQGRYHTSDLLDDEECDDDGGDDVRNAKARANIERGGSNKSTNVLAYETAEDFIGRKGTAGFALEDDDDDVYDNVQVASSAGMSTIGGGHASKFVGIGGEEYHTELIDHDSDAEGEDSSQAKHGGSVAFAGALSAWATGEDMNGATGGTSFTTKAVTSDGRPPLDGFVLGGSGGEKDITNKRFPGPDLPPNFEPVRHVFREEDLPEQVAEQSKKAKEEAEKTRGAQSDGAATSKRYTNPQTRDDVTPMAGNAFAGLAAAMKNRFTSGGPDAGKTEDKDYIGLRMPNSLSDVGGVALTVPANKEEGERKEIQVKRSTMLWNPEPLVCKRLGVRPPPRSTTPISTQQKQTEELYFNKDILGAAGAAAATASISDPSGNGAVNAGDIGNNDVPIRPPQLGDDIGESRPPMDLFKSIFGAPSSDSDDSSSSDEDDSEGEGEGEGIAAAIGTSNDTSTSVTILPVGSGIIGDGIGAQNKKNKADDQEATHAERYVDGNEEKDKSRKYRSRSRRSRSSESASSESSESSISYERRRRKKKSKRRKKERSKRHDDERKRPKDERRRKKRRKRSRSRSKSRDRGRDLERKPAKKSSRSKSGGGT